MGRSVYHRLRLLTRIPAYSTPPEDSTALLTETTEDIIETETSDALLTEETP